MLIVSCITGDVISTGQECFSTDTPFAWKLQGLELHNARPPFVKCIWATALVLFILIWLIRAGGNMNKGSPYIDLASLFFCHVFVFCLFISLPSFFFLFLSFPFFLFSLSSFFVLKAVFLPWIVSLLGPRPALRQSEFRKRGGSWAPRRPCAANPATGGWAWGRSQIERTWCRRAVVKAACNENYFVRGIAR